MKLNTIILSLLIVFSFILTGCEKKEIFGHKTVYGEATINGKHLVQYAKAEESLANQFWYLPLGGNIIAIEDDICYLQMMLRDNDWNGVDNFWLILVGLPADEDFPTVGHQYDISVQPQIDLGTVANSFYWSHALRDFYASNKDEMHNGIAGLSVPPSHDALLPLEGSLSFTKFDSKTDDFSVTYTLKGKDESTGESYDISGTMNGKLIVKQ